MGNRYLTHRGDEVTRMFRLNRRSRAMTEVLKIDKAVHEELQRLSDAEKARLKRAFLPLIHQWPQALGWIV